MELILKEPYKIIWLTIPIILILAIIGTNNVLDIQMHDTYIVIATKGMGIAWSIFLAGIGLLYWLVRSKKLVRWMTITHVVFTITVFVLLMLLGVFSKRMIGSNPEIFRNLNQFSLVLILVTIISQIIFLINLIISFFRNPKTN